MIGMSERVAARVANRCPLRGSRGPTSWPSFSACVGVGGPPTMDRKPATVRLSSDPRRCLVDILRPPHRRVHRSLLRAGHSRAACIRRRADTRRALDRSAAGRLAGAVGLAARAGQSSCGSNRKPTRPCAKCCAEMVCALPPLARTHRKRIPRGWVLARDEPRTLRRGARHRLLHASLRLSNHLMASRSKQDSHSAVVRSASPSPVDWRSRPRPVRPGPCCSPQLARGKAPTMIVDRFDALRWERSNKRILKATSRLLRPGAAEPRSLTLEDAQSLAHRRPHGTLAALGSLASAGASPNRRNGAAEMTMNMYAWKPHRCDVCGVKVYSQSGLDHHRCLLHDECPSSVTGAPITFRCASCSAAFARRRELLAHLAAHGAGAGQSTRRSARPKRRPFVAREALTRTAQCHSQCRGTPETPSMRPHLGAGRQHDLLLCLAEGNTPSAGIFP